MTNIAMENPRPINGALVRWEIIYFYGLFSMAMLNNKRVSLSETRQSHSHLIVKNIIFPPFFRGYPPVISSSYGTYWKITIFTRYLSIYLPIYLSICLSVYLSIYPSIYLSIYLFVSYRIASHPIVSYFRTMGISHRFLDENLRREVTTSTPAASAVLAPAMLRRMRPIPRHDPSDVLSVLFFFGWDVLGHWENHRKLEDVRNIKKGKIGNDLGKL